MKFDYKKLEQHSILCRGKSMAEGTWAKLCFVPFLGEWRAWHGSIPTDGHRQDKGGGRAHISILWGQSILEEIVQLSHAVGCKGPGRWTQSALIWAVRFTLVRCPIFFVFSWHKWWVHWDWSLYGKEALFQQIPPVEGGGDRIDTVTFEKTTLPRFHWNLRRHAADRWSMG